MSFILIPLLFASWQCFEVPPEPVAPSWNTQLSIPILDTIYYFQDAIADNPDIVSAGPYYRFEPEETKFDSINLGDQLEIHPTSTVAIEQQIGELGITMSSPASLNLSAEAIIGYTPPPNAAPVPAFNTGSLPTDTIHLESLFSSAHFSSGSLNISIHNSLPVTINVSSGIAFGNAGININPSVSISPHSTYSVSTSLTNKSVTNYILINSTISSPGSSGSPVFVHPDSGVAFEASILNGLCDQITGKSFQPVSFETTEHEFLIDDSTYYNEIIFKKGKISIQLENQLALGITARIAISELTKISNNIPMSQDFPLNANGTSTSILNLSDWRINSPGDSISNTVTCKLSLVTQTFTSPTIVTLHSTDKIRATFTSQDTPFLIKKVSGVTKPFTLSINDTIGLNIGKLSETFSADSVLVDSLRMIFKMLATSGATTDFKLSAKGINHSGIATGTMSNIAGGSPDPDAKRYIPGAEDSIVFKNADKFISNYLTKKGEKVVITGTYRVNPLDVYNARQIAVLTDTSFFTSSMKTVFPLRLGIFNGVFSDTVDLDSTGDDRIDKDALDKIKQASMFFVIENAIPINLQLEMTFQDEHDSTILTLPNAGANQLSILAGTASNPSRTTSPIGLRISKEEAAKFNDAQQIHVKFKINSGNQLVQFTNRDYIRIRAYANMVFLIDPNSK